MTEERVKDTSQIDAQIARASELLQRAREEIGKQIVGQDAMIDGLLMGIIAGGHVLLEGVPGLAKTLTVRTLSEVIDAGFKRIQFTPDLLPADLIGTMVYRQQTGEFLPRKGPVFSNIVLADEVNRAPAKVQSALLEAMGEHQVTIGDNTYPLPDPFFVLATQNPIEQEGTYPLPEAQLDRFMLKLSVDYPSFEEEMRVLSLIGNEGDVQVKRVLFKQDIKRLRDLAHSIAVDERIQEYIVTLVQKTRETRRTVHGMSRYIEFGASPRGSLALLRCSRIHAMMNGRSFVVPEDVKAVALNVLRHRLVLSYEAESEELHVDEVLQHLLTAVPVP
ncbi:AAA family ATPase [Spirochaeta africana]|uniref:MoxR-like ATPase n=1 Tax=Spirochaeta africana (strain ATCC 700263 / DSM 8902 / Z-7692) TaxID=889378 RepID=H9UM24_SPIAZ|nr:MoxR family ATPase [Spirochaeta africana]AFG38567.1 MoxR-like ATPase [Spirochaeta africana DSM 8902]